MKNFLMKKMELLKKKIVLDGNINIFENQTILDDWLSQINVLINK